MSNPTAGDITKGRFIKKSGSGLLLLEIQQPEKMYVICNPLTGVYRDFPAAIAKKVRLEAIMKSGES